jgi:hypothetical protein
MGNGVHNMGFECVQFAQAGGHDVKLSAQITQLAGAVGGNAGVPFPFGKMPSARSKGQDRTCQCSGRPQERPNMTKTATAALDVDRRTV